MTPRMRRASRFEVTRKERLQKLATQRAPRDMDERGYDRWMWKVYTETLLVRATRATATSPAAGIPSSSFNLSAAIFRRVTRCYGQNFSAVHQSFVFAFIP